jgi:hypothetical protein
MRLLKSAMQMINEWWGLAVFPCEGCKYYDLTDTVNSWCIVSYRSCRRNRLPDGECKPQAILWEQK